MPLVTMVMKGTYLPLPTSSTLLSLSLPLPYCMIHCVWGRTVICARPGQTKKKKRKKDRNHSCTMFKDQSSKLSLWHLATYFSHRWLHLFISFFSVTISPFNLFVLFSGFHQISSYTLKVGGQHCCHVCAVILGGAIL